MKPFVRPSRPDLFSTVIKMKMEILDQQLSICKINKISEDSLNKDLFFLSKTDKEMSLVCPTADAPDEAESKDDGWVAMRICGTLDFSLTGILSRITSILAEYKIGIFAISTYDTDYILVKEQTLEEAKRVLSTNGYEFV